MRRLPRVLVALDQKEILAGMPELVAKFEVEPDREKRMALAQKMQLRVLDQAPQMFLGQFSPPAAHRPNIKGLINTGLSVFWNARREGK